MDWFLDLILRTNWDVRDVDKLSWYLWIILGPHWGKWTILVQSAHLRISQPDFQNQSIAGMPLDSVGNLRTTFVLRTIRMRFWCDGRVSGVAAIINKNKNKNSLPSCPAALYLRCQRVSSLLGCAISVEAHQAPQSLAVTWQATRPAWNIIQGRKRKPDSDSSNGRDCVFFNISFSLQQLPAYWVNCVGKCWLVRTCAHCAPELNHDAQQIANSVMYGPIRSGTARIGIRLTRCVHWTQLVPLT